LTRERSRHHKERRAMTEDDKAWQDNYDARRSFFEAYFGPIPKDILKMLNMSGVWPGGGLFVIPASKLDEPDLAVYTTFGLSNPDMPTTMRLTDLRLESDGTRPTKAEGRLQQKQPAPRRPGAAGYGYEIMIITDKEQQWPLGFLQWAVGAEITNDVGLLGRVEEYEGLTVEEIRVGPRESIDVLIAKAEPPLPPGAMLPAGRMDLLVATTITKEEMRWSMENGRTALLEKLGEGGLGQTSMFGRQRSVDL
jgi:hypothetical protein